MLTRTELEKYIAQIIEWDALEVCPDKPSNRERTGRDLLIPYVMNDAVEFYLRLTDCSVQGNLPGSVFYPEKFAIECNERMDPGDEGGNVVKARKGLILYHIHADLVNDGDELNVEDDEETVTIWFSEAVMEQHCYQYHMIGHDWRDEAGQESVRRIVNLLCVIHDKYTYIGESAVNKAEEKLYPLIEFAPICYYTPINDPILTWYPETEKGMDAAERMAKEAGDRDLETAIETYRRKRKIGNPAGVKEEENLSLIRDMAQELIRPQHTCFWNKILELLEEGSLTWPEREYDDNKTILNMRCAITEEYRQKGYIGTYPLMEAPSGASAVRFVEEHPFTVMESDEYEFCIYAIDEPYTFG